MVVFAPECVYATFPFSTIGSDLWPLLSHCQSAKRVSPFHCRDCTVCQLITERFTERKPGNKQVIFINGLHYCASLLLSRRFAGIMRMAPLSPACGFLWRRGHLKVKEDKASGDRVQ